VSAGSLESVGRVVETWVRLKATDPHGEGTVDGEVWDSPSPEVGPLTVDQDRTLGPGLLVLVDLTLAPAVNLTVTNATVALLGNLTLGDGCRLDLVDSILAAADLPDGLLTASRFQPGDGAEVETTRSEWWGPAL